MSNTMDWSKLMSPKRPGETGTASFGELRSRFDQDYDRIIFSHPFRKLQDKTQVFPLPEQDFVHTRLTHSLEVSSVGRSLGKMVGKTIIERHHLDTGGLNENHFGGVVAAASLAHDIGNPPFGHSGEESISTYFRQSDLASAFQEAMSPEEWSDLIQFEGNAQGFRLLNHELYGGLKLTYATLAAFTKYPRLSAGEKQAGRRSQKKYGIFHGNLDLYKAIAKETGLITISEHQYARHPLTFLVEAADDICYHIIDLEDGCRLGLVNFEEVVELMAEIIGDKFSRKKLDQIRSREEKLGTLRALTISQLIKETVDCFLQEENRILTAEFDQAITDEIPSSNTLKSIIGLSIDQIYRSRQVMEREAAGFQVLGKLMEAFCMAVYAEKHGKSEPQKRAIFRLLPEDIKELIQNQEELYPNFQLVVDFVSGLTDRAAVSLYKVITGYLLPHHNFQG